MDDAQVLDAAAHGSHHDGDVGLFDEAVFVDAHRLVDDQAPEAGVEVREGVAEDVLDLGVVPVDVSDGGRALGRGPASWAAGAQQ
ncbi:hypothetical protein [Streptomyces altiplanensis]